MYLVLYNNQIIRAFWLVLAYDLFEDRRTIDVITTKIFPSVFSKAKSNMGFK